jgi:hypothetical protein
MSSKGQSMYKNSHGMSQYPVFNTGSLMCIFQRLGKRNPLLRGIREAELAQVSNSRKRAVTDKSYVQSPFEVLSSLYDTASETDLRLATPSIYLPCSSIAMNETV